MYNRVNYDGKIEHNRHLSLPLFSFIVKGCVDKNARSHILSIELTMLHNFPEAFHCVIEIQKMLQRWKRALGYSTLCAQCVEPVPLFVLG